jgi:hypothetical protein
MPITMDYDRDAHVIVAILIHPLRVEELLATFPEVEKYLNEAPHNLHWVIDTQQMKNLPLGVMKTRSSPIISHPNSGHIVIVGGNTFVRSMAETMFRLANYKRARFFNTVQDGLDFLKKVVENADKK